MRALKNARTDEAQKAALRSLAGFGTPWSTLAPVLEQVVANPATSLDIRGFIFGIVTFQVRQEKFGLQQREAVQFLCREFLAVKDTRLLLGFVLNLKLLLHYTGQSEGRQGRLPIERLIIEALKQRKSMGSMPAEIVEQYQDIEETHPEIR